ncbi:hypothetical protein [Mycoplasma hafezii]|uniref:hypothetical protein n=1 Tax=Mycoplasma hafezii TaxID=525886 RepID=UPI003CF7BB1C
MKIETRTAYEVQRMHKYEMIGRYFELSNQKLATMLNVSTKTIQRIKKDILIKKETKEIFYSFVHGNRFKTKENCGITQEIYNNAVDKYNQIKTAIFPHQNSTFSDITVSDFVDRLNLSERQFYSKSHFKKLLRKNGFANSFSHKKTKRYAKKLLQKKLKQEVSKLTKTEINRLTKIIEHINQTDEKIEKRQYLNIKENRKFGEFIELDACIEVFWNNETVSLFHAVDSATGKLLAIHCEKTETAIGYQRLLDKVFKKYGFPQNISTDRRRNFWINGETMTNFEKALNKRGIKLLTWSNPTFKPNVERSFLTAQMNYPLFFYENQINSIKSLNDNWEFIVDFYNNKFNKNNISKSNVFEKGKLFDDNPDFLIEIKRKITSGVFKMNGNYYAPFDKEGKRIYIRSSVEATLVTDINQKIWFLIKGQKFDARIPNGKQLSEQELWSLAKNLDINIPLVHVLSNEIKKTREFHKFLHKVKELLQKKRELPDEILFKIQSVLERFSSSLDNIENQIKLC